ncbi:MAG: LPS assembly lipoprotein LptE [Pirellulales bacterium]
MNRRRFLQWATALAGGAGIVELSGCAGYRMGTRTMFRTDVQTVHVPIIESDTYRRYLGERLTEAVVKQIELTTPYKVIGSAENADSILRCRLTNERRQLTVETRTDESRTIEVALNVQVDWLDRAGQSLTQRTEVPMPSSLLSVAQATEFIPEAGQSSVTAQQETIDALARQIVGQMEAAW